jgi:hypothetical protein
MQTKIKNPYDHKREEVSSSSIERIEVAQKAFEQGVQAAQQAPIVKQVVFHTTYMEDLETTVFGYDISISCEENADNYDRCHYVLRVQSSHEELDEVGEEIEPLKQLALEFLSDLITTELGHPVKFVL